MCDPNPPSLPNKPSFYIAEAAEYLGVSRMTAYRWCESGNLECVGMNYHRKVSQASFRKMWTLLNAPYGEPLQTRSRTMPPSR